MCVNALGSGAGSIRAACLRRQPPPRVQAEVPSRIFLHTTRDHSPLKAEGTILASREVFGVGVGVAVRNSLCIPDWAADINHKRVLEGGKNKEKQVCPLHFFHLSILFLGCGMNSQLKFAWSPLLKESLETFLLPKYSS